MDVAKINGEADYPKALGKSANMLYGKNLQKAVQSNSISGVEVDISIEARRQYSLSIEGLKPADVSNLKFSDEALAFLSREALAQRKLEAAERAANPVEIDPLENEFQIYGVTYTFQDGTPEKAISEMLEGKVINSSLFASEMMKKIRGVWSEPDSTAESRAMDREAALRFAEYAAQTYFDNEEDAKAFLEVVNKAANNAELSEKGYVVFANGSIEPYKSYTSPLLNGEPKVSLFDYAKKYYGATNEKEFYSKPYDEILKAYTKDMINNPGKIKALKDEIVKEFDENENRIQEILDNVKGIYGKFKAENNFMEDMNNFLAENNKSDISKWMGNMLKLFK